MKCEWDEAKNQSNQIKHGVRFEEALKVFFDPFSLEKSDDHEDEMRFVVLGLNPLIGVLVVIFCEKDDDTIRIISARKATKTEERIYEERI